MMKLKKILFFAVFATVLFFIGCTEDNTIIDSTPPFVPVANITLAQTTITAGTLALNGTVEPSNASNQAIIWSVNNAGTTGATISGSTLNTTGAGTAQIRATITNGQTATTNYTQTFSITVNPSGGGGGGGTSGNVISPNRTQELMNADVRTAFDAYSRGYLRNVTVNGVNMSYIYAQGTGPALTNTVTISEAHGYGMKIFALMNDRATFDRLNAFRKAHRSPIDSRLMAWFIRTPGQVPINQPWSNQYGSGTATANSATDGDLDIAYALLLAHSRWGGNYLDEAKEVIAGLKESSMHQSPVYRPKLGDWHARNWNITPSRPGTDPRMESRSSDWRPAHFRAFFRATNDNFWNNAADMVYTVLGQSANNNTGLMPDFVSGSPARPEPNPSVSGEHNMHRFAYNACRTPWFIAMDYVHYGTPAAEIHINRISGWLRGATNSTVSNIRSMRELSGTSLQNNYNTMVFVAPFASSMLANADNQAFLNSLYTAIRTGNAGNNSWITPYNAYSAAIQVLNMLLITGNWEAPL